MKCLALSVSIVSLCKTEADSISSGSRRHVLETAAKVRWSKCSSSGFEPREIVLDHGQVHFHQTSAQLLPAAPDTPAI